MRNSKREQHKQIKTKNKEVKIMENGLSLGEAMALTNKDNDGFGNGSWFMWIIALAIIFGNGGGFGFGGNNRGVEGIATRDAVNSGFQYNQLDNGIRGLQNGLCDGFYVLNNSVKDAAYALDGSLKNCCLSFVAA